jgi:hypothetical protein
MVSSVRGCCQLFLRLSQTLHHHAQSVHRLLYPAEVDDDDNNNEGKTATISFLPTLLQLYLSLDDKLSLQLPRYYERLESIPQTT